MGRFIRGKRCYLFTRKGLGEVALTRRAVHAAIPSRVTIAALVHLNGQDTVAAKVVRRTLRPIASSLLILNEVPMLPALCC